MDLIIDLTKSIEACRSEKKGYILIFYVSNFLSTPPLPPPPDIVDEAYDKWAKKNVSRNFRFEFDKRVWQFFRNDSCIFHEMHLTFFWREDPQDKIVDAGAVKTQDSEPIPWNIHSHFNSFLIRTQFIIIISL